MPRITPMRGAIARKPARKALCRGLEPVGTGVGRNRGAAGPWFAGTDVSLRRGDSGRVGAKTGFYGGVNFARH